MDYRYKLEIELDDEKILAEGKYELGEIYRVIRAWFEEEGIPEIETDTHAIAFASNKTDDKEFARFGLVEEAFVVNDLFKYVKNMTWYDTLYGMVSQEDVIKAFKEAGLI